MLYDYQCTHCDNMLVDVYQRMSDKPLVQCPEFKKKTLQRIITGGYHAFIKGDGMKTDSGRTKEAAAKQKEQSPQPNEPWYHKHGSASPADINKMTKKQKANYIMEGKK